MHDLPTISNYNSFFFYLKSLFIRFFLSVPLLCTEEWKRIAIKLYIKEKFSFITIIFSLKKKLVVFVWTYKGNKSIFFVFFFLKERVLFNTVTSILCALEIGNMGKAHAFLFLFSSFAGLFEP